MSKIEFPRRLFITGTDTGIGKTVVSAILMAGLDGTYWKPVQSGTEEGSDTEWVRRATGLPMSHFLPETYGLKRPLSPHASAAMEGVRIELDAFRVPETKGHLIVEGAGGIMVPLNDRHLMVDLMKRLGFPVLLVARRTLGTINHGLLSLEQLRRHGIEVFGVVMNGPGDQIPLDPPLAKGGMLKHTPAFGRPSQEGMDSCLCGNDTRGEIGESRGAEPLWRGIGGVPPDSFSPSPSRRGGQGERSAQSEAQVGDNLGHNCCVGNREAIEFYGKVKVLAEIEPLPVINRETLKEAFERYFGGG
ncbi:MAG: dethiobiotin synthase [Chloroflexi bacterium]|nr:dethiobiotin synthase [Chloroflexota bacterium]